MSISTTIKSIQDIMRKDVGVDGDAQRIGQLVWMFFLKIYDDKETEYELLDDDYRSPIPEALRWRNWAADAEGMTGDDLLEFVNNQLFPTLKNLQPAGGDKRGYVIRGVFEDAYNYMKSGHLMRQVINKIVEGVDFNKAQDRHLFGDLYEQILRDLQNAGNAGEYYTPRPVTQFMVDMVAPQLGEKIMDPACGTGGFLTCAIETVRKQHVKTVEQEQLLQESIYGVEKKPLPHLLCTTNMILHGIDVPTNVRHDNTLSRPLRDYGPQDRVDVIVTNPPFGGMEEDGIENNFPANFRTRETADLFLVLIMHLLKDGGRAAVVLPDGTLFGEGIKTRIKEQLLETCNLHTVVRLPNGVFAPYTGIKTNLLFFTKGTPTTETWFYEHPYPAGYKTYSKTKPMRIEEFEVEKAWWGNRVENEFAWKVSVDDIKARNYNLDIKNPHKPDAVSHDLGLLMADYDRLQQSVATTSAQLNDTLSNALEAEACNPFSKHLPLLVSAPDGIQKLRGLILELAVRGKLVPQDAYDEPASELLTRMAQERTRLENEGVCKKSKVLPLVANEEQPFPLPDGWEWTRLGAVSRNVQYGYTASADHASKDVLFLRITDIQDNCVDWSSVPGCQIPEADIPAYLLQPGDIVIARTGGTIGKSYLVQNLDHRAIFASYLIRVGYLNGTDARYTKIFLGSRCYWSQLYANSMGTGQPNVNGTALSGLTFPLPPLAEQRRIVAKVDELMALCDQLDADFVAIRKHQASLADVLIETALESA